MNHKIVIIGNLLHCKKGIYPISTLPVDTSVVIKELIHLIKGYCERINSRHIHVEIDESGVILMTSPKDTIKKDFDDTEVTIRLVNKYQQSIIEIEKLK